MVKSKKDNQPEAEQLVLVVSLQDPWFEDIIYFLTYGEYPKGLIAKQRRDLRLKVVKYVIWEGKLYKRSIDGTFLRCVDKQQ